MEERRSVPRIKVDAAAVLTPLASVTTRLLGVVVNASGRGIKIRVNQFPLELPRQREVYRIQCGDDLMLCEIRYSRLDGDTAQLGLEILHWIKAGDLNRTITSAPAHISTAVLA